MTDEFVIETDRGPQSGGSGRRSYRWLAVTLVVLAVLFFFGFIIVSLLGNRTRWAPDSLGVVEIIGVIADSGPVVEALDDLRRSNKVKAVVLRIDSPGGGVAPSQEIYREVTRLNQEKPVVVSMGSLAASGGLYVAAPASAIVANPGTLTGSIGVIMQLMNVEDLVGKVGLKEVVIKSGPYKDIGSSLREVTEEERAILQGVVDRLHAQFVRDLAKGRGMDEDKVAKIADGRVYIGEEALELGLVDRLGNFEDAVALAAEKAGIKGKPNLIYPEKKTHWLAELLRGESPIKLLPAWTRQPLTFQFLYLPGI